MKEETRGEFIVRYLDEETIITGPNGIVRAQILHPVYKDIVYEVDIYEDSGSHYRSFRCIYLTDAVDSAMSFIDPPTDTPDYAKEAKDARDGFLICIGGIILVLIVIAIWGR